MMNNASSWLSRLSLRQRLLLASTFWIGGLIALAGVTIPILVQSYLVDSAKTELSLVSDEIIGHLMLNAKGELSLSQRASNPRFDEPYSGYYWVVSNSEHKIRSRSLWDKDIAKRDEKLFGANDESLIFIKKDITIPELRKPLTIVIGFDEDTVEDTVDRLIALLSSILSILFIGLMVFNLLQITWSLKPLTKLQTELKALEKGENQRLSDEYPAEIKPIISDLNALLFHYQELLARARHHAGNLSHSLKTPLAILKNQADKLPTAQKALLNESIEKLQQQIDYHLSRARMAGSMNILFVKSNPAERVDAISLAFDKVYSQKQLVLVNELDDQILVAVDSADLDEMLGNLIENGYKWANSLIRVHSNIFDEQIEIIVEDDGKGVAADKLNDIAKRGVRFDEATPGSGLGLNIVAEMAHSYRGKLSFAPSKMGGLKAMLLLNLSR